MTLHSIHGLLKLLSPKWLSHHTTVSSNEWLLQWLSPHKTVSSSDWFFKWQSSIGGLLKWLLLKLRSLQVNVTSKVCLLMEVSLNWFCPQWMSSPVNFSSSDSLLGWLSPQKTVSSSYYFQATVSLNNRLLKWLIPQMTVFNWMSPQKTVTSKHSLPEWLSPQLALSSDDCLRKWLFHQMNVSSSEIFGTWLSPRMNVYSSRCLQNGWLPSDCLLQWTSPQVTVY